MAPPCSKIPSRGPADRLSAHDLQSFCGDLKAYVQKASLADLWQFGAYGGGERNLEKKAPFLDALLNNAELWSIFLKYMPMAKLKDAYVEVVLRDIMITQKINNQKMNDEMFIWWFCKAAHVQLTHLRDLKRYPQRFAYRVSLLSPDSRCLLTELLSLIKAEFWPRSAAANEEQQPRKSGGSALESVLAQFLPSPSESMRDAAQREPDTQDVVAKLVQRGVPSLFMSDLEAQVATPKKRARTALDKALDTPPLPARRGEIKAKCAQAAGSESSIPQGAAVVRAFVEQAHKGNIRSAERVRTPDNPSKVSWAEVTLKQSADYQGIIRKIADAINMGHVKTKDEATRMKEALIGVGQ